jgi:membrane-bound lytic murein transglycosylase D
MNLLRDRPWPQTAVAAALLFFNACSVPKSRPDHEPKLETGVTRPAPIESDVPVKTVPPEASQEAPWQRLRGRLAFPGCEHGKAVLGEAQRYTRNPTRFSENWRKAMPLLLLVLDEIERRDMPAEFALLPYVESHYRQLPARHNGAAGMWQLMARTAVDRGLKISRVQDQRLDPQASTEVALDLLEHLEREFSDWRVANMAFNAGEFRIKRALGSRRASDLNAEELAGLKVSATTHQHLARLLALSCIIGDPDRFKVTLPLPQADDVLREVKLPTPIDLRLASTLAGMSLQDLLHVNAGWTGPDNQAAGPATRLLLPESDIARFNAGLASFSDELLGRWNMQRIEAPNSISELASRLGISPSQLALANQLDEHSLLQAGQTLLLPGGEPDPASRDMTEHHRIVRGDTLSAIARHYSISLADLLHWNALTTKSILRPGQTLRIRAPSY